MDAGSNPADSTIFNLMEHQIKKSFVKKLNEVLESQVNENVDVRNCSKRSKNSLTLFELFDKILVSDIDYKYHNLICSLIENDNYFVENMETFLLEKYYEWE